MYPYIIWIYPFTPPIYSHSPLVQLNTNTYSPPDKTHTLLPPNTRVFSHLITLRNTYTPSYTYAQFKSSFSLSHHHLEYPHNADTPTLLHTPTHPILSALQLYTHLYTPQPSPRCAQILSLTHTHHLDILHHTLPLPRYTRALTHLHIIQIYPHLNAPAPIHPYSYTHTLPQSTHIFSFTNNTDTFILSSTYIVHIPPLSLSPSRYPYMSYMPMCVKYTHPHAYPHAATPNVSLVLSFTQIG